MIFHTYSFFCLPFGTVRFKGFALLFLCLLSYSGLSAQSTNCVVCERATTSTATGTGAVAAGIGSTANGGYAVSIGFGNDASGTYGVAIGYQNDAGASSAVAMGNGNTADGPGAFAVGQNNTANGSSGIAAGANCSAGGTSAIAFGQNSVASGNFSIAMGLNAEANGTFSQAYGEYVTASGLNSIVIGGGVSSGNPLSNSIDNSLAVGFNGTSATFFVGPPATAGQIGQVGIGTTSIPTGHVLAIGGSMISEAVEIRLQADWPDYVFQDSYRLMSFDELEAFVRSRHHLPGVPSEAALREHGLNVEDMQAALLKQVEELTLRIIDLNKEIEALKAR